MTRAGIWMLIALGFALSCAVPVPPSGGPEDTEAPRIIATIPDSAATGVPVSTPLAVTFSEKMARSKLERLVTTHPPFEVGEVDWDGNTMTIKPLQPFVDDTTYLVTVKPGYRDSHNVPGTAEYSYPFATAAHLDSGSISGSVLFRRKATGSALVRCFVLRADTSFDPATRRPDRETGTDDNGTFRFSYLPTDGSRFIVWAFQDQNSNGYFERDKEFGQGFTDTVSLDAGSPRKSGVAIAIIDPTEPGEIEGVITNQTGADSVPIAVALDAMKDTVVTVAAYIFCDPDGSYHIKKVPPGRYVLRSFIDFKPDSSCGAYPCHDDTTRMCIEPCALYPDSVIVGPGERLTLDTLILAPSTPR